MRAVVQRVSETSVTLEAGMCAAIEGGLLVYLGVAPDDGDGDAAYLAEKIRFLRVFADEQDKLNLDVVQAGGAILVVSAFTTMADARRGRRPSFEAAAQPEHAHRIYEKFCDALQQLGVRVERGSFGDYMKVKSVNAGPICLLLDSRRLF